MKVSVSDLREHGDRQAGAQLRLWQLGPEAWAARARPPEGRVQGA